MVMMTKEEMKEAILAAKQSRGLQWADLALASGLSPEYTCSACLGMNHLDAGSASAVTKSLGLPDSVSDALQQFPYKTWSQTIPTDPVIYRWYEMINVYGETIKELIHERFGDGIMSAIDFTMHIEREADPKGDRVKVTMSGKFLPYKSW
jgi:cyanate lyase